MLSKFKGCRGRGRYSSKVSSSLSLSRSRDGRLEARCDAPGALRSLAEPRLLSQFSNVGEADRWREGVILGGFIWAMTARHAAVLGLSPRRKADSGRAGLSADLALKDAAGCGFSGAFPKRRASQSSNSASLLPSSLA